MVKVVATQRGYFGQTIRDPGDEPFDIPDEIWNDEKRRPSWVKAVKFGGKGDHDGDGKDGGMKPAEDDAKPKRGRKPAEEREHFDDAPEPTSAKPKGNGVKEALGVDPDWVAPKPID